MNILSNRQKDKDCPSRLKPIIVYAYTYSFSNLLLLFNIEVRTLVSFVKSPLHPGPPFSVEPIKRSDIRRWWTPLECMTKTKGTFRGSHGMFGKLENLNQMRIPCVSSEITGITDCRPAHEWKSNQTNAYAVVLSFFPQLVSPPNTASIMQWISYQYFHT